MCMDKRQHFEVTCAAGTVPWVQHNRNFRPEFNFLVGCKQADDFTKRPELLGIIHCPPANLEANITALYLIVPVYPERGL